MEPWSPTQPSYQVATRSQLVSRGADEEGTWRRGRDGGRGLMRRVWRAPRSGSPGLQPLVKHDLLVLRHTGGETRLAECQVVLPGAHETVVETHPVKCLFLCHETSAPLPQRPDVVLRDVRDPLDDEAGPVQRSLDDGQRWQEAAGEDVGLDPVGPARLAFPADVGNGDGLQAHATTGHQGGIAGAEEG